MTRRTLLFIRLGVFIVACGFLYVRFARHVEIRGTYTAWRSSIEVLPWKVMALVLVLMVVNWGLEALKWQGLMRPVQRLSWGRCFVATIAGTSIGLITPNRVGEFAGRVLFLDPEHRVEGSFATLLGSIAQFVATVLVGSLALFLSGSGAWALEGPAWAWAAVKWSALLVGGAAVFLYFNAGVFARLLLAIPWLRRFEPHARVLDQLDRSQLVGVLLLSLSRYAVFTVQFALLLRAMAGVDFQQAVAAIPLVFLLTTLVPTTALTELGVRGSVAAMFVPGSQEAGILLSTTLIWLINVVAPALIGSVLLLVARIRTAQDPA